MSYRPSEPFSTPVELFNPTYVTVKGVRKRYIQRQVSLLIVALRLMVVLRVLLMIF